MRTVNKRPAPLRSTKVNIRIHASSIVPSHLRMSIIRHVRCTPCGPQQIGTLSCVAASFDCICKIIIQTVPNCSAIYETAIMSKALPSRCLISWFDLHPLATKFFLLLKSSHALNHPKVCLGHGYRHLDHRL